MFSTSLNLWSVVVTYFCYDHVREEDLLRSFPVLSSNSLLVNKANAVYYLFIRTTLVTARCNTLPLHHLSSFSPPTRQLTPGTAATKVLKIESPRSVIRWQASLYFFSFITFFVSKGKAEHVCDENSFPIANRNNNFDMTCKESDGHLTALNAIPCILYSLQTTFKTVHWFLKRYPFQ